MLHKHHIIPRHAGGTNSPSNIKLLTISDHAKEHKLLFEKHGRWQDEVAFKTLSGQISNLDATKIAQHYAGKTTIQKQISEGKHPALGHKCSDQWKRQQSERAKGNKNCVGKKNSLGSKRDEKWCQEQSERKQGKQIARGWKRPLVICPHCQKSGGSNLMKRYHSDNCKGLYHGKFIRNP
jgi:HNH endonuclease